MTRTPPYLHVGDTISLVAPSFGCTTEPYLTRLGAAIKRLEKAGYKIKIGKNVYRNDGVCASASPEERVEEFMEAYLDPESKLVLSVGGGEFMNEMMPLVDFDAIAKAPEKWFMGFSDNANLTFPLTVFSNIKTIYGPNAPSFYEKPFRASAKDALAMLAGEKHFLDYPKWTFGTKKTDPILWRPRFNRERIIIPHKYEQPVEGTLLGGCMDSLVNLLGTRLGNIDAFLEAHPEGIIWYFEACDLNALSIRRALFQLREAGWFKNAKMFLFGRHYSARFPIMGVDRYNAAIDILSDVPMLFDVALGHIGPSLPMMNGAKCRAAFEDGFLVMDYLE